jgi:hypothetical protein
VSSWGEGIMEMFHLSKQFTAMEPSNAIASLDKVQILDGLIILNALFDILMGSPPPSTWETASIQPAICSGHRFVNSMT